MFAHTGGRAVVLRKPRYFAESGAAALLLPLMGGEEELAFAGVDIL